MEVTRYKDLNYPIFKGGYGLHCLLNLLLQDAPLSDCAEFIDGLDLSEQVLNRTNPVRKVLTDLLLLNAAPTVAFPCTVVLL